MSRARKFDPDAAVETVLEEVWRDGFRVASVANLAKVLGITRSSFYHAFGSKEALFERVLYTYLARMPMPPRPELVTGPVLPVLARYAEDLCRFSARHDWQGCLITNSLAELRPADGPINALVRAHAADLMARVGVLLGLAVQRRELPADTDLDVLTAALQTMSMGLNTLGRLVRDEREVRRVAQRLLAGLGLNASNAES